MENSPPGIPWQEHGSPLQIGPVASAELSQQPLLFVPGQEIVDKEHTDVGHQNEEAWPVQEETQPGDAQAEVLGMADHAVQAPRDDPLPEQFGPIYLARTHKKDPKTQGEQDRTCVGQYDEEGIAIIRDVGQEKRREPGGPGASLQPGEDRRVDRIEVGGKWGDHDDHLKGHQQVEYQGSSPCGLAPAAPCLDVSSWPVRF